MKRLNLDSEDDWTRLALLHRYAQVGHCVNGVTHDINNLLGAAMAYAELASLDTQITPETARMLDQIVDGITKCSVLIKSLTSIARKDRPDINLASPDKIMEEVLLLRDYELKMAQITVEKDFDGEIPSLPVDLPKMKLAFILLLMNAQEALRDKSERRIRMSAGKTPEGAYIELWDSGGGLDPEIVEEAFEPLTTFWPDGQHMGMGLYMARQIAALHGGDLTYSSDGGFRMTLKRDNGLRDQY